jgi:PAS domain S-box-containing protein
VGRLRTCDHRDVLDIPDSDEQDRLGQLRVHLETVQRIAGLGSWEADVRTDELTWSANVYRILGVPETVEPSYGRFLAAVHPDDRRRIARAHADAIEGPTVYSLEHRIIRPDGTIRHVHEEAIAEREDGEVVRLLGTMQDITDRMALTRSLIDTESRRRELLHRLVRASEHERAQLAGDLHDGPIQMLTVAAMRLEHLGMVETDTPDWLPEAVQTVRETVVQLRDVLVELHPRAGAGDGLEATLTQLALTVVPDLDVRIEVRGDADEAESRAVFGIVQEALWDVREGDRSLHLDIDVDAGADALEVVLTGAPQPGGRGSELLDRAGLLGVRERTEGVGGRCTVDHDDNTSAVRCTLPRLAPEVATPRA